MSDPYDPSDGGTGSSERHATASLPGAAPLGLDASAALVGEYRWIEHALYRLLGQWVTDMPIAAVQVHLDAQSMRHAWHAELFAERLPVMAGSDPDGWTVPSAPTTALFAALSGTMPPGVRISGKAFGKDRRMPITNHYRSRVGPGAAPVDPVPGDAAAPATVSDGSIGEATTIV